MARFFCKAVEHGKGIIAERPWFARMVDLGPRAPNWPKRDQQIMLLLGASDCASFIGCIHA